MSALKVSHCITLMIIPHPVLKGALYISVIQPVQTSLHLASVLLPKEGSKWLMGQGGLCREPKPSSVHGTTQSQGASPVSTSPWTQDHKLGSHPSLTTLGHFKCHRLLQVNYFIYLKLCEVGSHFYAVFFLLHLPIYKVILRAWGYKFLIIFVLLLFGLHSSNPPLSSPSLILLSHM